MCADVRQPFKKLPITFNIFHYLFTNFKEFDKLYLYISHFSTSLEFLLDEIVVYNCFITVLFGTDLKV